MPKKTEEKKRKSALDVFQEAYEKNPRIVKKFILWKIVIFVALLTIALLANKYLLTPYVEKVFG